MTHATRFRAHSVLPGFNLALGFTLLYLSLIVLVPLSALFFNTRHAVRVSIHRQR